MQDRHFSDEELVAFLDGEEEFAPVDAIKAALAQDPALVKRLEALQVDLGAVKDSFDLLQAPNYVPVEPSAAARSAGWARPAVAACVALAIGFGLGSLNTKAPRDGWVDYVAAYQALYSQETIAHLAQPAAQLETELARVSASIGKDIGLETLTGFDGATYKRAQILSYEGRPLVQLAFGDQNGVPIALCIIRKGAAGAKALEAMQLEGLSAAVWSEGDYEYLLIGGTEQGLITRMGQHFETLKI